MLENREQYEWALSRVEALVNDVGYKPVKSHFFCQAAKGFWSGCALECVL